MGEAKFWPPQLPHFSSDLSENEQILIDSSRMYGQNLVHKLQNYRCEIGRTKTELFGRLYFGPYGVLAPQILTRTTDRPRLASPQPQRGRGSPQNLRGTCKTGLKIQGVSAYNFGGSGNNVTKLFHATCSESGVFKWAQLLGKARPLKFGRRKFGAISDNFPLWSRISPERIDPSKIRKLVDQLQPLPRWAKKVGELWSTNRQTIFRHLGGVGPSNFYTRQKLTRSC